MPFAEKMKRDVWNRQRGLCNYCGLGLTFNGGCEMDHSVPKSWLWTKRDVPAAGLP